MQHFNITSMKTEGSKHKSDYYVEKSLVRTLKDLSHTYRKLSSIG